MLPDNGSEGNDFGQGEGAGGDYPGGDSSDGEEEDSGDVDEEASYD
jgi:hypothetical protein